MKKLTNNNNYVIPSNIASTAFINSKEYEILYTQSINNPEVFWNTQGKILDWIQSYSSNKVKNTSFLPGNIFIKWYEDGTLNVTANCIDRHLKKLGHSPAIIWEGEDSKENKIITFYELHREVCRFSNVLVNLNIKKSDVVAIYLPMIPEVAIAMLACARIGAVHSVIFAGFSPDSISDRIIDSHAKLVITADESIRNGRKIPLKNNIDIALSNVNTTTVKHVIVVQRTGNKINWIRNRDIWWHQSIENVSDNHTPIVVGAEEPLFILYTSGSTGKPKGVLHSTAGYLVYVALTFKYVFDYHENDVYWCTADVGWITGHSYLIYGPLACGATTLMFEGVLNWPKSNRMLEIVDKYKVTQLYTAPTVIRTMMAEGDRSIEGNYNNTLRVIGSVGEPINPEAWKWYYDKIGNNRCPIVDTWWQTETGGIMITPLPGATNLKAGSVTKPFFGIQPALVNNQGNILEGSNEGNLVIIDSWPGQARTLFGNHTRFEETYFSTFKNFYFSGDGARRDEDGYYWITGRVDDVLNISGHRLGTAEIESALVSHCKVAEAAVVGIPHTIKGQMIYAYITLYCDEYPTLELYSDIRNWVRKQIGPIATPDVLHCTKFMPKTRSGKIMRRILRKIASGSTSNFGDVSTLADPDIIEKLLQEKLLMNNLNKL